MPERLPTRAGRSGAKGRATRARVLEVATQLIAERGYDAVTMRAIGEAAGLDNSSLYKHFRGKDELAAAVFDAAAERVVERVRPLEHEDAGLDRFLAVSGELAELLMREPQLARLMLQVLTSPRGSAFDLTIGPGEGDRPSVELFRIVMGWFVSARRRGVIRRVDVLEVTVSLVALHLVRPATAGNLLASQEGGPFSASSRRARRRELSAFLRGALAPRGDLGGGA